MGDPVVYFEILGQDGARLRQFYASLFGWEISPVATSGGAYQRIAAQDDGIQGGLGAFPGAPGHVTFYVRTDDLIGAVTKATALGARTIMPPTTVAEGVESALIADPEGHVIGLIKGI
jgi:predicted enzyme related to lactoylglutathione lyase